MINQNIFPKTQRIIAHIDMNSYFASVEQQARPALRGKPIAVTGPSKRSIIVAASIEAKKFGVKTGTMIPDAFKLCPQIIPIKADCRCYEAVTRQFLEIFISKTPEIEIFSIDEAFLDLTSQLPSFAKAKDVLLEIKQEIKTKIGSNIKCSVGLAGNKFMAKLASEAKKPDGLTVVLPGEEIDFIDHFKLDDTCGIGRRIMARLNQMNIYCFKDLREANQTNLTLAFGSYGLKLYNMARGIDNDPIRPYYLPSDPKSISRSKTLAFNTFDKKLIEKMILSFCQNISAELRRKGLIGGSVAVYLRYGDFSGATESRIIKQKTHLTTDLFICAKNVLQKIPINKSVRKIGVCIGKLQQNTNQMHLLSEYRKPLVLDHIIDRVNYKYGKQILQRSSLTNIKFDGQAPSYGFKKDLFS